MSTTSSNTAAISELPPNAALAARSALDTAMADVSSGSGPGSSRKRAGSSTSKTSQGANGTSGDDREEGEISQDQGENGQKEMRTVFEDPENFNVKHPLASRWTLWFDNPSQKGTLSRGTKDSWGEDLNKVVDIDCVEEFWGLYHNIIPPSDLPPKANYYLFKENIQPAWEDAANAKGGKWSVQFPRDKTKAKINELWLYTMLSAIGETLDAPFPTGPPVPQASPEDELITGVIMAARPNFFRIAIWTRKADTESEEVTRRLMDIGKHFKVDVLGNSLDAKIGVSYGTDVEFQSHVESEKKKGKKTVI